MKLDNVTLICVDCNRPDLALKAMQRCMDGIEFKDAVLLTTFEAWKRISDTTDIMVCVIEPITSKEEYSQFIMKDLVSFFNTEFVMLCQWDGFVINPDKWDPRFLDYDYIGAPWWFEQTNVGNGGFSIRSFRLMLELTSDDYPETHPEDAMTCRTHRPLLEERGFTFAPVDLAKQFSYEPNPKREPFAFHTFGMHGMPQLINR